MWSDILRIRIWNRIEKSSQNRIRMHPYDIHIKIEYKYGYPYLHFKQIIQIIQSSGSILNPGSLGGGGRACASASLLFWAPLASLPELPLCRQLDRSRVVLRMGPCTCRLVDFADRWVLDYSSADRMFLESQQKTVGMFSLWNFLASAIIALSFLFSN